MGDVLWLLFLAVAAVLTGLVVLWAVLTVAILLRARRSDAVDEAYAHAAAVLTTDALPGCQCQVCVWLDPEVVDDAIDGAGGLEKCLERDIAAGLYDVDGAVRRLLPPTPPVIPGRDQDD